MSDVPASEEKIQIESLQYLAPSSSFSMEAIGALANALREIISPVGSIVWSMLDESTFQDQNNLSVGSPTRWVLANGQSASGSDYQTLTGFSSVPDLRGQFLRGKNNGRSDGQENPDGDLAVGTQTTDKYRSHAHGVNDPGHAHGVSDSGHTHGVTDSGHNHGYNPAVTLGVTTNIYDSGTGRSAVNVDPFFTGPAFNIANNTTGIAINAGSSGVTIDSAGTGVSILNNGANETAPKSVTLNPFIRIN